MKKRNPAKAVYISQVGYYLSHPLAAVAVPVHRNRPLAFEMVFVHVFLRRPTYRLIGPYRLFIVIFVPSVLHYCIGGFRIARRMESEVIRNISPDVRIAPSPVFTLTTSVVVSPHRKRRSVPDVDKHLSHILVLDVLAERVDDFVEYLPDNMLVASRSDDMVYPVKHPVEILDVFSLTAFLVPAPFSLITFVVALVCKRRDKLNPDIMNPGCGIEHPPEIILPPRRTMRRPAG
jgi:hypothetical protein